MERPGNFDSREADLERNILGLFCDWGILKQEKEDRKSREGPASGAGSQAGGPPSSNKELVIGEERTQVINKDFFIVFSQDAQRFQQSFIHPQADPEEDREGTKITLQRRNKENIKPSGVENTKVRL